MKRKQETLEEYLRCEEPPVSLHHKDQTKSHRPKSSTTKNNSYVAPRYIKPWDDFNLTALHATYKGLLDRQKRRPDFSAHFEPLYLDCWDEKGLETVLYDWNSKIVCVALREAQQQLDYPEQLLMVRGCQADKIHGSTKSLEPDWAGIICSERTIVQGEKAQDINRLPGDTKISTKWPFMDELRKGTFNMGEVDDQHKELPGFRPFRQIFTYCTNLGRRYGYIITDKEMIPVRISPFKRRKPSIMQEHRDISSAAAADGLLEFAIIKWRNHHNITAADELASEQLNGALTVNLSLWWLYLLAAEGSHIDWEYGPLEKEPTTSPFDSSAQPRKRQRRVTGGIHRTESSSSSQSEDDVEEDEILRSPNASFSRPSQSQASAPSNGRRRRQQNGAGHSKTTEKGKRRKK